MRPAQHLPLELRGRGEHVIRPVGDLTAQTALAFHRSVSEPLANGARIVLDLSLTRRIDAGGRQALIDCARAVHAAKGRLVVLSAPRNVRQLLRADAQHDAEEHMAELDAEFDDIAQQLRRLEARHGRRVCAAFVCRTTTGDPLLCALSVGHSGTHQWH